MFLNCMLVGRSLVYIYMGRGVLGRVGSPGKKRKVRAQKDDWMGWEIYWLLIFESLAAAAPAACR